MKRCLKKQEIKREFGRLVAKYDPDEVQRRIDQYGYGQAPMETIRFGDWQLQVKLRPLPPDKQAARKARVAPWPQGGAYDSSVPNVKQKIKDKLKDYGPTDDPLTLAVNVYNLGGFNPKIDGHDVLFFSNTAPYAVPSPEVRLFVNPALSPDDLPAALRRLPHIHGPDGSECKGGESVPSILGARLRKKETANGESTS